MNGSTKRPRPKNESSGNQSTFIDLTGDDEEPRSKRAKSIPPAPDNDSQATFPPQSATHINSTHAGFPRATTPEAKQGPLQGKPFTKKSPFKSKPSWLTPTLHSKLDHISTASRSEPSAITPGPRKPYQPPSQQTVYTNNFRVEASDTLATRASSRSFENQNANQRDTPSTFRLPSAKPPIRFNATKIESSTKTTSPSSQVPPPPTVNLPKLYSRPETDTTRQPHVSVDKAIELPLRASITPSQSSGLTVRTQPRSNEQHRTHLFQRRPSTTTQPLKVQIPVPEHRRKRQELQRTLQRSTEYAKSHPKEAAQLLGVTGYSTTIYPLDLEEKKYKNAAQPKQRSVDRSKVRLDFGPKPRRRVVTADASVSNSFVHPRQQAMDVLTDRFGESFDPPLKFSNDQNESRLNGKFQFVKDNIIRKGARAAGTGPVRTGCAITCANSQSCSLHCSCLTQHLSDKYGEETSQIVCYKRRDDGLTVLTDEYMDKYSHRAEIYECSDACHCSSDCINRVVQKGRTVPLEIFQTARCGFGVRSSKDIFRGQFIECYLGEILVESELSRREAAAEEYQSAYVYSLDWFTTPGNHPYHIDGQNFGSAMRFVNHSCSPNAKTFTVMNHQSTNKLYSVGFFAIQDIRAGTEITIDYVPKNALKDKDNDDDDDDVKMNDNADTADLLAGMELGGKEGNDDNEVQECLCGTPNCRKKLWGGPKRKARRKLLGDGDD